VREREREREEKRRARERERERTVQSANEGYSVEESVKRDMNLGPPFLGGSTMSRPTFS
jgi:hypothetical protein